jgi:hypothetical protein
MDSALYKLHTYVCVLECMYSCMCCVVLCVCVCVFLNASNRAGWTVARCVNAFMYECIYVVQLRMYVFGHTYTHTLSLFLSFSLTHT